MNSLKTKIQGCMSSKYFLGGKKLREVSKNEAKDALPKSKISSKQKMVVVMLSLADFLSFCAMSIMAPFYPKEATERGMSETVSGLVFGIYGLTMFLTSPVVGKIVSLNSILRCTKLK